MKFLFCSLGSYGFINPLIGIAKVLAKKGHQVAFVTHKDFTEVLHQEGLERIKRNPQDGSSFQVKLWAHPEAIAIQVKHIETALTRFKADVLVGNQLTFGTLIAGEIHHLPVAILGLAAYLWPTLESSLKNSSPSEKELRSHWRYADMMSHYKTSRQLLGLQSSIKENYRETPLLGDLFLLQTVPELETEVDNLPSQVHLVGSCLWESAQADSELFKWLDQPEIVDYPLIYVQMGRSFQYPRFWEYLIEAFSDNPFKIVAAVGRMDGELTNIPFNFFIREHIPQGLVLPYAKAVISNGHTTSVLGALTHGLPSLLLPNGSGTEDIAERCSLAGVAINLLENLENNQLNAEILKKALENILQSSEINQKAEKMGNKFKQINGIEKTADLLENLAIKRKL